METLENLPKPAANGTQQAPLNELFYKDLSAKRDLWLKESRFMAWTHILLGILGIACSSIVAAKLLVGSRAHDIVAVCAVIIAGILAFATPEKRSRRLIQAYSIIDPALRDYCAGLIPLKTLSEFQRQAEAIVHATDRGEKGD